MMRKSVFIAFCLQSAILGCDRASATSASSLLKALSRYASTEAIGETAETLAKELGEETIERVTVKILKEGGEESLESLTILVAKHGPDAIRALDNSSLAMPVLRALEELPANQAARAAARLAAGSQGKELAAATARYGAAVLRAEILHPGIGGRFVRTLGTDGASLCSKLTADEAIAMGRYVDDIAQLAPSQRGRLLEIVNADKDRFFAWLGRFVEANPGKTIGSATLMAVFLPNSERILGGDEIVFDAEGNPIVISKTGLAGRTLQAGGRVVAEVSNSYIRPLYLTVIAFVVTFATLFMLTKLWHVHQREKLATTGLLKDPETLDANATPSKTIE